MPNPAAVYRETNRWTGQVIYCQAAGFITEDFESVRDYVIRANAANDPASGFDYADAFAIFQTASSTFDFDEQFWNEHWDAIYSPAFVPAWQQFDGSAWLETTGLTGAPTSPTSYLLAFTYSPGSADMGVMKDPISHAVSTFVLNFNKSSGNRPQINGENSANSQVWQITPVPTMAQDAKYLILASLDAATNGQDLYVINLADGTTHSSGSDTTTDTMPSAAGLWVIGANTGSGTRAIAGQMERVMLWLNDYADVSDSAVRAIFHTSGVLADPADIITAIGSTPIISIVGNNLQNGTNAGSGGNFTKDGAGSITAV
jgi:hypothetical protein